MADEKKNMHELMKYIEYYRSRTIRFVSMNNTSLYIFFTLLDCLVHSSMCRALND